MRTSDELKGYVQKFQGGSKEAFERIYQMSYPYLHTCAIHVVRDEDAAQDVLQDAYIEIVKNIGQLRNPEDFLGWAAVIANRKCYALLKTRNRELLTHEEGGNGIDLLENVADNEEFIPESLLQNQEKQRLIREIIDGLTDMQRLCVIAFYYNQLSQEEIAQELGIPVNTVKSHLNRAKAKIKEAVIDLDEKKGTRLYSLAPFMLLLFGAEAEACGVPEMSEELIRAAGLKNSVGRTGEVGKAAGKAVRGRIYALLAVGLAVAAGVAGLIFASGSEKPEVVVDSAPVEAKDSRPEELESDRQETAEPGQHSYLEKLFVLDEAYESYGNAYGGVIPVKKDGLWGAVDYENRLVVPFEYTGFYAAPDKLGNIVLYNSVITEEIVDWSHLGGDAETVITHESREYFLFDNQGNLLYQGEDMVRASGGMYITLHYEQDNSVIEYHSLDGTVLFSHECSLEGGMINTFYDGISNVNADLGVNIVVNPSTGGPFGPREGDVIPRIGTVDLQGSVSWRDDPYYYIWWDKINEQAEAEAQFQEEVGGIVGNGTGMSVFLPRFLLSTMNHGYYITGSKYIEPSYISIFDDADNWIATICFFNISVDESGRVDINESTFNESNVYRGYYVDGGYLWNYGPHMVFVADGKDVLVDLSKNTNQQTISGADEVVTAVYDYIAMADEKYWLVQSGDQWGYIDHDGSEAAMFQDAGDFVGGYALVKEDGEVWLIDEEFRKLESLGQADSVSAAGELYSVTVGGKTSLFQIIR